VTTQQKKAALCGAAFFGDQTLCDTPPLTLEMESWVEAFYFGYLAFRYQLSFC